MIQKITGNYFWLIIAVMMIPKMTENLTYDVTAQDIE